MQINIPDFFIFTPVIVSLATLAHQLVVCLSTNVERALHYTIVKFDFNN